MSAAPALEVVRHPRARRAKLRVDPVTGVARLTLPPRAALKPALAWVESQAAWIAAARARIAPPPALSDGAVLPLDGADLIIAWSPTAPRTPAVVGDQLVCGGPAEALPARVLRWLRAEARSVLTGETAECAARAHVRVESVAVGDPRSRWGSCTGAGAIRYSWRLVMAPGWVRRAVVAHEVAHRVHMHHGPDFHRLAAELNGADPKPAMQWLRANGARLQGIGRSSTG